jgi:CopG family nickel-responsive transcriptional regulator
MELVRFGVAMEADLLEDLDGIVAKRKTKRSEILRDLVRAEVAKEKATESGPAVATLTLVYDHHVRDLTERLTELQHNLGGRVRSTLHVHLSHNLCLEVIIMQGRADELRRVSNQILATRGVKQGGLQLIAGVEMEHDHDHAHPHPKKSRRSA